MAPAAPLSAYDYQPHHSGLAVPTSESNEASGLWNQVYSQFPDYEIPEDVWNYYNKFASGGKKSTTDRTVRVFIEGKPETALAFACKVSTTCKDLLELVENITWMETDTVKVKKKTKHGWVLQRLDEEVASVVALCGIERFDRPIKRYEHPIVVLGAGLGGIQVMLDMMARGRDDMVCLDRLVDFGGHSWTNVPNKYTKLQTEKATYNCTYCRPYMSVPDRTPTATGNLPYAIWPTRDMILAHLRNGARENGLYEKTLFNTEIQKVKKSRRGEAYEVLYGPADDPDGDTGLLLGGAVTAWPGFLHDLNIVEFSAEDTFEGYMEYSSFDMVDYTQCVDKVVVLYGHGAFAIENCRTLVEFGCKKCLMICRKRNLSGTKMVSWMVGALDEPFSALCLIEGLQKMYDLVYGPNREGFDAWTSHGVTTDEKRTAATIQQSTIFGVTDIYFLACYFGITEVIVDDIKRCSYMTVHTKTKKKFKCDVVIKACGTKPSHKVDRDLGIKEVVGFWVNNDPLRPINVSAKGVAAKNFGSFSQGPGFAGMIQVLNWFLDYPEDYEWVQADMPVNKAGEWPAYVAGPTFSLPIHSSINKNIPLLAMKEGEANAIKARKQWQTLPIGYFLGECKREWQVYCDMIQKRGAPYSDIPAPPYPYTEEYCLQLMDKSNRVRRGERINFWPDGQGPGDAPAEAD